MRFVIIITFQGFFVNYEYQMIEELSLSLSSPTLLTKIMTERQRQRERERERERGRGREAGRMMTR